MIGEWTGDDSGDYSVTSQPSTSSQDSGGWIDSDDDGAIWDGPDPFNLGPSDSSSDQDGQDEPANEHPNAWVPGDDGDLDYYPEWAEPWNLVYGVDDGQDGAIMNYSQTRDQFLGIGIVAALGALVVGYIIAKKS